MITAFVGRRQDAAGVVFDPIARAWSPDYHDFAHIRPFGSHLAAR